jgi:hypothetical protein
MDDTTKKTTRENDPLKRVNQHGFKREEIWWDLRIITHNFYRRCKTERKG